MSVKVKVDPIVTDLIRVELNKIKVPNLSNAFKKNLIDSIIRGFYWFIVLFENSSINLESTWFESTEINDFDMSKERKGIIFGMTGLPFLSGCWKINIRNIQDRRTLGLNPFFAKPSKRWNKAEVQYEFLTRGWRAAAVVFIGYQT